MNPKTESPTIAIRMSRWRLWRLALVGVLFLVFASPNPRCQPPPSAAVSSAGGVSGEQVHYFNGAMRVDLVLALDELQVSADPGSSVPLGIQQIRQASARAIAAQAVQGDPHALGVRLSGVVDRTELNAEARRLRQAPGTAAVEAVLYASDDGDRKPHQRQVLTRRFSLKLREGQDLAALASRHGFRVVEQVGYSPRTWIVEATGDGLLAALDTANALYEKERVEFATPLIARQRLPRLVPNDPLYSQQWHLANTGSNAAGAVAGNDVRIEDAWTSFTGAGINIAITDDGLQVAHPDLAPNARTDIDIDINNGDDDPSPNGQDNHGTSVAGVAAARGNNALGVTGAAFMAGLVGVRLISKAATDAEEAQAMLHQMNPVNAADRVHVNSNSWGPADDALRIETFGPLTGAAFANAAANGRGGRGTIFVWAAGNGLTSNDNVNYDGYASSRYTIAVGATGAAGQQSYYSEPGASMLVNTPSNYASGSTGITTTDRTGGSGYSVGDYTSTFGGTSSATPLASGCIALMLQANPNLSWRDVQYILSNTATKNSPSDSGWFFNGAGRRFNHKFGFGRINATAAVAAATTWTLVPPESPSLTASESVAVAIPDNNTMGITRTLAVAGAADFLTEHVEVTVNIPHTARGNLAITLTSPSGTASQLATQHTDTGDNYSNWMFTTVANWGENPNGTWSLKVADLAATNTGTLNSWSIRVYGYAPSLVPVALSAFLVE